MYVCTANRCDEGTECKYVSWMYVEVCMGVCLCVCVYVCMYVRRTYECIGSPPFQVDQSTATYRKHTRLLRAARFPKRLLALCSAWPQGKYDSYAARTSAKPFQKKAV